MLKTRGVHLFAFACLYVSFGATFGFLGGAAPIILRERGFALAQLGLLQLIYLPLGLSFVWAVAIDKIKLPRLPRRVGWIAAMQGLGVALLLILTNGERWPVLLLLILALAISFAFATMDVALEALVVGTVRSADRPIVTTAKLCGASVGNMFGAGVLTISYAKLGWHGSLLVVALLDVACVAPILCYPEIALDRNGPAAGAAREPGKIALLLKRALLLGLYFGASSFVLASDSFVLLDLHVSRARVGLVIGTLGPAINLAATLASGALMAMVASDRLVMAMATGVAASGGLLIVATNLGIAWLGVTAVILGAIAASGLGVPVFNAIYGWAQGSTAAVDYSLLFGVGFLAAMPARVGGPALAEVLGWPVFFALTTPVYLASLVLLASAMKRSARVVAAA